MNVRPGLSFAWRLAGALFGTVVLAGLWGASPALAVPRDLGLLAASAGEIRFAVAIPECRLDLDPADSTAVVLAIPGYENEGAPGAALLPVRVVTVAVPPSGAVGVQAWILDADVREEVRLGGGPPAARPGPARLVGLSWLRDQRIARIAVSPASWDAAGRRLVVARRIEVEVRCAATPAAAPAPASDAAFEPLYRELLVNYEQGRSWRAPGSARRVEAPRASTSILAPAPPPAGTEAVAEIVPDTTLYAGRNWVKIAIPRTGFYRVEFGQLRNTTLFGGRTNTPHDRLRLFTWPGVPVLPESTYCDSCDYREVALQVVDAAGSKPDTLDKNNEYFYFFALGASDWASLYDPTQAETVFVDHPYETRNYVYLTIASDALPVPGAPRRIGTISGAFTPADTLSTPVPAWFGARIHNEVDTGSEYWPDASPVTDLNLDGSYASTGEAWEKFFWASLTAGGAFTESFDLPGRVAGGAVRVRARAWGLSSLVAGLEKSSGVPDHVVDFSVGAQVFPRRTWDGLTPQTFDSTLAGLAESGNGLTLQVVPFTDPSPRFRHFDRVGFAWFDVFYARRFEPIANELAFDSDPAGGAWLYKIGSFSVRPDSVRVFDVTDPLAPVEILDADYRSLGPGAWEMRFRRVEDGRKRYRIVPDWSGGSGIVKPPNSDVADAPSSSRQNLRRPVDALGRPIGADFLLIYYDGFRAAADTLLRWRRARLPIPGHAAPYDTFSVPVSALYDQFSGGRTDPAAIRNFLRAAYTHWSPRPSFVTFLGDASFDFKNLKGQVAAGTPGTLVPTYEGGYDLDLHRQFAGDDWMLNVNDPVRVVPDFFGGRIPAADLAQAMAYVRDKLLPYERAAARGEWRDRVMLIADDNEQGDRVDRLGWKHLQQTVQLDRLGLPADVDRGYVYLHTYADGPGNTKPGAKADILRGLEDGVVMFNYIGHGSPFKISDESVFLDLDASALTNRSRPSVFVAASCDVGKFNDPSVQSLGEQLVRNPNGGAIAVISATEQAFSDINAALNLNLYQELFRRDGTDGQYQVPLAQALLAAKSGAVNNQKYQLMGDAAAKLALPQLHLETTLTDVDGNPVGEASRGRTMRLEGRVLDRPGGAPVTLDGIARLLVEDSAPIDTAPACFGACVPYPYRAAPMFRGDVAIRGGRFETRFVVPVDGRLGPRGRARGYGEVSSGLYATDGAGSVAFTVASGELPADDREGPRITLGFTGGSTSVRRDALLKVNLFDPSGILITGYTPQNGVVVTVDDNSAQRYEITSSFRYAADSYQSGTAFFQLPGLAAGAHRIRVSAADNLAAGFAAAAHRSAATIEFEVTDAPVLRVTRAILFPNPVRSGAPGGGGQFVVDAPGDSVNVLLRLYTVAGRLVRTLEARGGLAQVQIPWDGLDAEGSPLATGTYLFKVQVRPREPDGSSSDRQRAQADGRFVVVDR